MEIWMGWLCRESGNEHGQHTADIWCIGDNGHAYGRYQFDNRYALVPFMQYCVANNETHYCGFNKYISMARADLQRNIGLMTLWRSNCDNYTEEFTRLQDNYAKAYYYDPAVAYLLNEEGIEASKHSAAFRGSLFSMSIRSGQQCAGWKFRDGGNTEEQILRNAYAKYGNSDAGRWPEQLADALGYLKQEEHTLTGKDIANECGAVCNMARTQFFTYGDSRSKIPCADQKISCDRMIARALWDFNFQDQPVGGMTVMIEDSYLTSHGFYRITDANKLTGGDIVLMDDGQDSPNASWHTFIIMERNADGTIDKYDCGSQARVDTVQPFCNVPINEWSNRRFHCGYRYGSEPKPETAPSADSVMRKAISFLGTKESPAGSNNVIFNTDYYGHAVSGSDYPWCCDYVWDIFRMAAAAALFFGGNKTAECKQFESWALSAGLSVGKNNGQYGDIVTFDFGQAKGYAHHIGFIKSKNTDGTYQTIEGNTSVTSDDNGGAVMERTRSQADMRYIFRPKYGSEGEERQTMNYSFTEVRPGDRNSVDVLLVQEILKSRICSETGKPYYTGPLDWEYTAGREDIVGSLGWAVRKFQRDSELKDDGIVGKDTFTTMLGKYPS